MPRSWAILAFSLASAMPAALTRMSEMSPGTRRSMTKIRTDIPNSVRTIRRKRRARYDPIATCLSVEPDVFEAPAVIDAVVLQHDTFDLRRPAGVGQIAVDHQVRAA